jgi:hypothetical protein
MDYLGKRIHGETCLEIKDNEPSVLLCIHNQVNRDNRPSSFHG